MSLDTNKIHLSTREIKPDGRISVSILAHSDSSYGSKGKIKATCVSLSNVIMTDTIEWEIIEPPIKLPDRQQEMPEIKILPVDRELHKDTWNTMIAHSCFKNFTVEEQERMVSYDIEPISSDGIITIKVNIRYPEYIRGQQNLKSNKQRDTYQKLIEKELTHIALFDVMNQFFPKDKNEEEINNIEGDEGCINAIDSFKYRHNNNNLLNICYRASKFMKEQYSK